MKSQTLRKAGYLSTLIFLSPFAAQAHEAGDIIMRMGAASVTPDESSSLISSTATGPLANTSVGVDDDTQLGLNIVYMLNNNWGLEVLAATPFEHDIDARGLSQYGFSTTALGSSKHLPPTVTLDYFFGSSSAALRPYVGAGLNYTVFFDEELTGFASNELAASNLELDDSWGVAWRAGFDYDLGGSWLLNASVWKIDIETDASFNSALGTVNVNADINPWVYMVSLGYKF